VPPPVDVVAKEQEVVERRRPAHLEQLQQIIELAVDVADDNDRGADLHAVLVTLENLSGRNA
jgi:hypothetical protein